MSKLVARRKVSAQEGSTTRTRQDKPTPAVTLETPPSPVPTVPHAEITARAYHLFLARGGNHGDDQADWFRAKAELRREKGIEKVELSGND